MKLKYVFFIILISFVKLTAQVKIGTTYLENIIGYKTSENDSVVFLISQNGDEYNISKSKILTTTLLNSEIITKDGERLLGNITYLNSEIIVLCNDIGSEMKIERKDIRKFIIANRLYSTGYFFLGLSGWGPGGINLLGGVQFETDLFFRTQYGSTFGNDIYGYQFNLGFNITRKKYYEQNVSLGAGVSFERKNWQTNGYKSTYTVDSRYVGLFYDTNLLGFFLELGATYNEGYREGLNISYQFGYIFRFL
jgi:hypothetical protein